MAIVSILRFRPNFAQGPISCYFRYRGSSMKSELRAGLVAAAAIAAAAAFTLAATNRRTVPAVQSELRFDQTFWKTWGDGQAELSAYDLTYPRYGKPRHGVA